MYADYMELTKFKLSLLNSIGSYTMFYYHAPLAGVGFLNSAIFMFATQSIAMSPNALARSRKLSKMHQWREQRIDPWLKVEFRPKMPASLEQDSQLDR